MNKTEEQLETDEKVKDFKEQPQDFKAEIRQLQDDIRILKEERKIEEHEKRLYFDEKLNEVFTAAPTYIPKTFREQFCFYLSGGEYRLYVYISGAWKHEILS